MFSGFLKDWPIPMSNPNLGALQGEKSTLQSSESAIAKISLTLFIYSGCRAIAAMRLKGQESPWPLKR